MKRKLDQSKIEICSSDKNKWNRIIIDKGNNIVEEKMYNNTLIPCYITVGSTFIFEIKMVMYIAYNRQMWILIYLIIL